MKNKLSWLAGPYVLWMALVVIVPILLVVVYAFTASGETAADIGGFTLDNFSRMGTYTVIFARSFQLALVATLVCLLIGYPLAYVMAKEGPGFQRVAMVIIMLPMWVNFLLRTYAWMAILENNGILNNFFEAIGLFSLINSIFGTDISFFPMIRTQGRWCWAWCITTCPLWCCPSTRSSSSWTTPWWRPPGIWAPARRGCSAG